MTLTKILIPICLYCLKLNFTKLGQLNLRKIIKIVAIRCQILRLKCTRFDFGWGSTPAPLGELSALPRPRAVFKGPTSKGREGREGEGREGKERKDERRRGKDHRAFPQLQVCHYTTDGVLWLFYKNSIGLLTNTHIQQFWDTFQLPGLTRENIWDKRLLKNSVLPNKRTQIY